MALNLNKYTTFKYKKTFSSEINPNKLVYAQYAMCKISEMTLKMIQRKNNAHICVKLLCKIDKKFSEPLLRTINSKLLSLNLYTPIYEFLWNLTHSVLISMNILCTYCVPYPHAMPFLNFFFLLQKLKYFLFANTAHMPCLFKICPRYIINFPD